MLYRKEFIEKHIHTRTHALFRTGLVAYFKSTLVIGVRDQLEGRFFRQKHGLWTDSSDFEYWY